MAEGSTHVRGTGKFFEFCAKRNQESWSPPKCFTSSGDGNCGAMTGSNLFYHSEQNLVFGPVLKGEEGSNTVTFCLGLELWYSTSKYTAKGTLLPALTWPDKVPGALYGHQLAAAV